MACKEAGGYDCKLLEVPPTTVQVECPVCKLILKEPCQISCCGYGFCQSCILKVKDRSKPCPCCNMKDFNYFMDKRLKRLLNELKVSCVHQGEKCTWDGKLGELQKHLNVSPSNEDQLEGCKYVGIECLYCIELMKRSEIEKHQENCLKRPFGCVYCERYTSTYEDVTTKHWSECYYFLLPCPNSCGVTTPRHNFENHVNNKCPLTVINCDFKFASCEERLPRKDMPAHLCENIVTHLSLQAAHLRCNIMLFIIHTASLRMLRNTFLIAFLSI